MAILAFPPLEQADENGLLALGGDLETDSLLLAYSQGIFPWPIGKRYPLAWFSPDPRGVIDVAELHTPKSLIKDMKRRPWRVTFNRQFSNVILNCAMVKNRKQIQGAESTWITPQIIDAYNLFHLAGHAYSVEVWLEEELVGGLYGVHIGQYVCGESMFHHETNASKIALIALLHLLKLNHIPRLDTQMVTTVVQSLGGKEISRAEFIRYLENAKNLQSQNLFCNTTTLTAGDLIQP